MLNDEEATESGPIILRALRNCNDIREGVSTDWPSPKRVLAGIKSAAPDSDLPSDSLSVVNSILEACKSTKWDFHNNGTNRLVTFRKFDVVVTPPPTHHDSRIQIDMVQVECLVHTMLGPRHPSWRVQEASSAASTHL